MRIIRPSLDELGSLPTPLTVGERRTLDLLDNLLDEAWEIYVQPHVNGLRPDFVALNPKRGCAVFEVKDWQLEARPPVARRREVKEAIRQVQEYQDEIREIYCPSLLAKGKLRFFPIRPFLVCPSAAIRDLGGSTRSGQGGAPFLDRGDVRLLGMEWSSDPSPSPLFDRFPDESEFGPGLSGLADDLRHWLYEPAYSVQQRTPLRLDARQEGIISNPPSRGYRRVRGPAGSGKSVLLAARAADLAAEGKEVLVVTFNLTLLQYLRDLAARRCEQVGNRTALVNQITWLNYHAWCKRICRSAGLQDEYHRIWRENGSSETGNPGKILHGSELPQLAQAAARTSGVKKYDAILVDEGQDFEPLWWESLRELRAREGEMWLFADSSQDLYGVTQRWTDVAMGGAGFSGPWVEVKTSYRMPGDLVDIATRFGAEHLPPSDFLAPQKEVGELAGLFPFSMRHFAADCEDELPQRALEVVREVLEDERADNEMAMADWTFLVDRKEVGRKIVVHLERSGIRVIHTFGEWRNGELRGDKDAVRRSKSYFYKGDARIKVTTIHCFKGWEGTNIVLVLTMPPGRTAACTVYSGLTRVRRSAGGSSLAVLHTPHALIP